MRSLAFAAALAVVAVAAAAAAPGESGARTSAGDLAHAERSLQACVQRERVRRSLPRLRADRVLTRAARSHARAMRRRGFFSHVDHRGEDAWARVARRDRRAWRSIGEAIATGVMSARSACRALMRSRPHRKLLLHRRVRRIGTGVATRPSTGEAWYVLVLGRLGGR